MTNGNSEFKIPDEFLRENRKILIDVAEQVFLTNTKCPHCECVITFSEALTKPFTTEYGFEIPAFDESGVMVGECLKCHKEFTIDVTNPDFSEFQSNAKKLDYYYDNDEVERKEKYNGLVSTTKRVEGDDELKRYYLNYIYDDHPLYICNNCGENLEGLSLGVLENKFGNFSNQYYNYVNWSLKNSFGDGPEYVIIKLNFECTCGSECKAFFFKKYVETTSVEIVDFSICNIIGSRAIDKRITSGVYTKDNSVSWLYKLIPRWTILFDKIYIITPFIGHQWLKSEILMETWLELVNRLDHKKSKILVKYGQFKKFKEVYKKLNGRDYETLNDFELGSNLLSELKQNNDFHAKVYCGISQDLCEVFSGSANLVKGKSMEVMHFNIFDDLQVFNDAFLAPLGVNEVLNLRSKRYSMLFDSEKNFNCFLDGGQLNANEYKSVILGNTHD